MPTMMKKKSNQQSGPKWHLGPVFASGSFATVHIGHLYIDGTPTMVAIKIAPVSRASSLLKEKAVLRSLRGPPEILQCLHSDTSLDKTTGEKLFHLFLELSPHRTLADLINSGGPLQEPQVRVYTRSILLGLCHVHARGYVHCDVKPGNILVWGDEDVKIADFGLAKRAGERKRAVRGTLGYVAPEGLVREEYEAGTDVWALGCVVIEMAMGRPAWRLPKGREERIREAVRVIGRSEELPELPRGMSEVGWDFLSRCLEKDPEERWTAEMLLENPFVAMDGGDDDEEYSDGA